MSADQVVIAANPKSGARSRDDLLASLCHELRERQLQPVVCTDLAELAERIAVGRAQGKLRAVVAAGGDGTVSAVASRSDAEVPIAILPLGTENLLSKYLECRCDPVCVAESIRKLQTRQIDCGSANGRLFLVMVGVGFDASVVHELDSRREGHIRHWSYAVPIWRTVMSYKFPKLKITASGVMEAEPQTTTIKSETKLGLDQARVGPLVVPPVGEDARVTWDARWAFIANVPRYAAGLPIAPWALSDDGLLDICSFRSGGVIPSLRYLMYLAVNRHRTLAAFRTVAAKSVVIEADTAVSYQIDGDYGGQLPLTIEILPKRLNLVMPVS